MLTFATKLYFALQGLKDDVGADAPDSGASPGQGFTVPPDDVTNSSQSNATNVTEMAPAPAPKTNNLSQSEYIGYMYVIPTICILGIILNTLVILVLRRRMFRSPTYTFLCALAAADIVTAVFTAPGTISRCDGCPGIVRSKAWLVYEVYVFVPITNMSECVSAWMTTVLAVERLLAIKFPMLDRSQEKGKRRAYFIVAMVTLAAVILNIPYFFILEIVGEYYTKLTSFGAGIGFNVFSWFRAIMVQFLPLVLLVILNILLVRELRLSQQRYRKMCVTTKGNMREKAQIQLTLMLIGTVAMFVLGHIPVALAYSVIFRTVFGEGSLESEFYPTWLVVTHALALTSYALDFVVYCALNKYFRQACVMLMSCDRQKRRVSFAPSKDTSEKKIALSDEKY